MGSFFAGERMEDDLRWREEREKRLMERNESIAMNADVAGSIADEETEAEFEEKDDEDLYFAPERGNVIFASAFDGWGFRIGKFAQLYVAKLGIKEANLRRVLWGDYFLDPKDEARYWRQTFERTPIEAAVRPIRFGQHLGGVRERSYESVRAFSSYLLYAILISHPFPSERNPDKIAKIVATLNLKILPRDLKSKDTRNLLTLIFSQWLSPFYVHDPGCHRRHTSSVGGSKHTHAENLISGPNFANVGTQEQNGKGPL